MARKRRNGKSKSEKETEPKEEAGFLGELLKWLCSAPFPINGLGLVLRRIPPPWNKRTLAIVLFAIGILIVHSLVPPVRDFSLWLYYRVIPGPQVQVNFNNLKRENVSIGEKFKFWISEYQDDKNPEFGTGTIPDVAIPILMKTNKPVNIHLGRKREIHRLYRGSGYLRLCFNVNGTDIEIGDDCNKVISDGLTLVISDPNHWTSLPIALWFSEMEGSTNNKGYLHDHVFKAISMIEDKFNVFQILAIEPNEPIKPSKYSNRIVLNIKVGCYRTRKNGENELRLKIVDKESKVKRTKIEELYENTNTFESADFAEEIIKRLREQILQGYPPLGIIDGVQPEELPSEENAPLREICLNIGRLTGIRRGDSFDVQLENQDKDIGKAKVMHVMERESSANLISDSEEVKKGCRVKWKNPGG